MCIFQKGEMYNSGTQPRYCGTEWIFPSVPPGGFLAVLFHNTRQRHLGWGSVYARENV